MPSLLQPNYFSDLLLWRDIGDDVGYVHLIRDRPGRGFMITR